MVRQRSEDKRDAIMAAATQAIANQGLSAPTALIAKEAGVSNGSLFTYFETKTVLFNCLYLELKTETAAAILKKSPVDAELHEEFFHAWNNWMSWALSNPQKRKALAQLSVSDEISPETREAGHKTMTLAAELLGRGRANGPMQKAPMGFVVALMNSVAEATMEFMAQDPANARKHSKAGFDALWRMLR